MALVPSERGLTRLKAGVMGVTGFERRSGGAATTAEMYRRFKLR